MNEEQKKSHKESQEKIYEAHKDDAPEGEDFIDDLIYFGINDPSGFALKVPSESLSIIIGKNTETLKMLVNMSGVTSIKIANEGI